MRKTILRTFSKERKKVIEFVEEDLGKEKQLLARTYFEKNGKKIWYLIGKLRYFHGKDSVNITDIWTKPSWRRRGIASSLVLLLKTTENKNVQTVPHKSFGFYKKLGFEHAKGFKGLLQLPKEKKINRKVFIR